MPATPRKMLVASLASACDRIRSAVWIAHLSGVPMPSAAQHARALHAELRLRGGRDAAVARAAPARPPPSPGAGAGQLPARRAARARRDGRSVAGEHRLLARSAAIKLVRPELLGASSDAEAADDAAPVRARGAGDRGAELAAHDPACSTSASTADRHLLLRDGAARRARPANRWCASSARCRPTRALFLLRQVCHSLADAHARGLVHRDVTPANIYVCRMGLDYDFVKVLDFGLVKFNGRRSLEPTLMTGRSHDDRARRRSWRRKSSSAREVDQRADVYAIGCVAYYLLTGQLGVRGRHADEDVRPCTCRRRRSRRRSGPRCRFRASSTRWCWRASTRIRAIGRRTPPQVLEMLAHCRSSEPWDSDSRQRLVGTPSRGAVRPSAGVRRPAARTSSPRQSVRLLAPDHAGTR